MISIRARTLATSGELRKGLLVAVATALLLALGACGEEEDPNALRVPMEVVEGCSDVRTETCQQSGYVLLTPQDSQTSLFIKVNRGALEHEPQPSHIYSGRCASLGDKMTTLEGVVFGESRNTVDAALASLTDGNHAIAIHRTGLALRAMSEGEAPVIVCGDIPSQ